MKKRMLIFVLALACVFVFGCTSKDAKEGLAEGMTESIASAYEAQFGVRPNVIEADMAGSAEHGTALICYGVFDGMPVLFEGTDLPAVTSQTIGDREFVYPWTFALYAYKDGRLMDLKEAYEQKLISDSSLSGILAVHKQVHGEKAEP